MTISITDIITSSLPFGPQGITGIQGIQGIQGI